jgi:hypothetical protein
MIQSFIAIIIVVFVLIVFVGIKIMICLFTDRLTNEVPITKVKKCAVNTVNPTHFITFVKR